MTFRIDHVRQRNGTWLFDIKGIQGQGVYGTLLTDGQGKGLYLMSSEIPIPTAGSKITNCDLRGSLICSPEEFWIPAETSTTSVGRILAEALLRLGWGPEVDQRNRALRRERP